MAVVAEGDGVQDQVGVNSNCPLGLVKQMLKWRGKNFRLKFGLKYVVYLSGKTE